MLQRIREGLVPAMPAFTGPVVVDEAYFGGLEKNQHEWKRANLGRGPAGKTAVVGMKDRETCKVKAPVMKTIDAPTLQQCVYDNTEINATLYTDEAPACKGMVYVEHGPVKHSVSEYVNGMAHTNGVESFWAALKRAYYGVPTT